MIKVPFAYCYVRDVFPVAFYQQMLDELPDDAAFTDVVDHDHLERGAANPQHFPGFWGDLCEWMGNVDFVTPLVHKFADVGIERFNEGPQSFGWSVRLVRDTPGYWLGPHTDLRTKFLSFLFYLPRDDSMRDWGTTLLRHKDPTITSISGRDKYPLSDFTIAATMPFMPNTCLAFARTDRSFHCVLPSKHQQVRHTLLLNVWKHAD